MIAVIDTASVREHSRDLPTNSRYLPMTSAGSLSKRMRTESVLTFQSTADSA
jgi:hypothetical protein